MTQLVLVANAGDGTITTYHLDDAGQLTLLAGNKAGAGIGSMAVDAERNLVYAGVKDGPAIVTLRLDRASGELKLVSVKPVVKPLAYVSLARGGSVLLAASYHGGFATAYPLDERGTLGEMRGRIEHPNCHAVIASGDDVYVTSLGADLIAHGHLDADATLSEVDVASAPKDSGPRHLVLDSSADNLYVITEFSGEILHFRRDADTGSLQRHESVCVVPPNSGLAPSALGKQPLEEPLIWGADIHLGANDQIIYTSERSTSTLAATQVESDGSLGQVLGSVPTEKQPRGFGVSRDGRWLVASGEKATQIAAYALNGGLPEAKSTAETGPGGLWVTLLDRS